MGSLFTLLHSSANRKLPQLERKGYSHLCQGCFSPLPTPLFSSSIGSSKELGTLVSRFVYRANYAISLSSRFHLVLSALEVAPCTLCNGSEGLFISSLQRSGPKTLLLVNSMGPQGGAFLPLTRGQGFFLPSFNPGNTISHVTLDM